MGVYIVIFLICGLLSVCIIYSKTGNVLKLVTIPAVIFGSVLSFYLILQYQGKPIVSESIPPDITVYGQLVDKENETIYLLFSETGELPPPIYVQYIYNEGLHKALSQGKRQGKGEPFRLTAKEKGEGGEGGEGGEKGEGDGKGKNKGKKGANNISLESASFGVHALPPPVMVPKTK